MLFFDSALLYVREGIALVGAVVITGGALISLYHLVQMTLSQSLNLQKVRLQFGNSIILGLEFMVGADIVGSLVQPDYYNVGILAILVIIRTILSYFLHKELMSVSEL
jgi:uncharacterized membrane protein